MYWQVYLHKTVLSAENMLVKMLRRAKALAVNGVGLFASPALQYFLYHTQLRQRTLSGNRQACNNSVLLDDYDIMGAIKVWAASTRIRYYRCLCNWLINRNLFKCILSNEAFDGNAIELLKAAGTAALGHRRERIWTTLYLPERPVSEPIMSQTKRSTFFLRMVL